MKVDWRRVSNLILRGRSAVALALIVAFASALAWASAGDSLERVSFELRDSEGARTAGIVVLPRPVSKHPVVIFLHGSGGNFMKDGPSLRQFAELGFAAVSIDYNQTDAATFQDEFSRLLAWVGEQSWARENSTAWIGNSLGAQRSLNYMLSHPGVQPELYVRMAGGWVSALPSESTGDASDSALPFDCPTMLLHGANDRIFPESDCEKLHGLLADSGVPADLRILPNQAHGFRPDRGAVIRAVAEYCAEFFKLEAGASNQRASRRWFCWMPVFVLLVVHAARAVRRIIGWSTSGESIDVRWGRWVSRGAWLLSIAAILLTAVHMGLPRMAASDANLGRAGRWLVWERIRGDFEYLRGLSDWEHTAVGDVTEHAELANYREPFLYPDIDGEIWRQFVVSPIVDGGSSHGLDWRRPLWESFYPRVRNQT
ncbi:MAG: putative esterase, partial [Limisphaerales bacterium]